MSLLLLLSVDIKKKKCSIAAEIIAASKEVVR